MYPEKPKDGLPPSIIRVVTSPVAFIGRRSGAPTLGAPAFFTSLTIVAVLSQPNKRALLFVALLVAAFLVGFGLGIALWEGSGITVDIFE